MIIIKTANVILMTVVGYSDLPEDRSSVLLLGVTKLQTSPLPTRRPSSLPAAVDTDQSNNLSSGQSARSSCSPRIIITHTSQRCNANNVVTNKKHLFNDAWDDELLVGGDFPTTNGKITPPLCNSPERVGWCLMDKSVDSIGTCSLDAEASIDVPGRTCVLQISSELVDISNFDSAGSLRECNHDDILPDNTKSIELKSFSLNLESFRMGVRILNNFSG